MGLAIITVLALLGEAFLLYFLVHWVREGRPRKRKPEVHRKKPFVINSRQAADKKQLRDFEETIHRRIARYTVFGTREFGKK
jgi:hypothetical protein